MGSEINQIKHLIDKAINLYNKYRSPEASAELVNIRGNTITIRFKGTFCETCGINDWIEDFVYVTKNLGINTEIIKIIEPKNKRNIE